MSKKIISINGVNISYRDNSTDMGVITEVFIEDPYKIMDIPNNAVVVDIGANIGTFSVRCANEKNCIVYAYEPCNDNYKLLVENILENRLGDRVKTFKNAVSDKKGIREFYVDFYHYAGSSFYLKDAVEKKTFDRPYYTEKVECITLRQIFEDNNIEHCHILKIDCEQEEKNILLGGDNKDITDILKRVDRIMLEFHTLVDGKEIAEYLKKSNGLSNGFTISCDNHFQFERGMIYAIRMEEYYYDL